MMTYNADLEVSVPVELVDEFLRKLPYVSEALAEFELEPESRTRVQFTLRADDAQQAILISDRIAETARKMCRNHRPGEAKVLIDHMDRAVAGGADPHPALEANGQLFYYGPGRYGLGPECLQLFELFDRRFVRLAKQFSAVPQQYPNMIGADTLDRCKYFQSFPHSLSLISHLREDLEALQEFAKNARWDGSSLKYNPENLSEVQCLLAPAICFHCYAWLHDSQLAEPKVFTAVGKCFRYESSNLKGLERLWDFTMREIIFVGPKEYVLSQRRKAIDEVVLILDEWGLAYDIRSATDPFFIEEYSAQVSFQSAFDLKYEIQALLPYTGKTLAVGSFNHHQDFFGRSFDILSANGELVHTGCAAFGLERLVLAFLAQHGIERSGWPVSVRNEL
jgi:tRNA synthetase class II (G, H, P, S and T)